MSHPLFPLDKYFFILCNYLPEKNIAICLSTPNMGID